MCRKAKELHATIGELIIEAVAELPGDASRRKFWELMRDSVARQIPPQACPEREARALQARVSGSAEQALAVVDQIRGMTANICENGEDFATSVMEKADSIGASVERAGRATDAQLKALENMRDGLERWHHD